jgi:hypothetical protein
MSLLLQSPDNKTHHLDKPELTIGSDPSGDLYLPYSGISSKHAVIKLDSELAWLIRPSEATGSVHLNGRMVSAAALLKAGDEIHFNTTVVRVKSIQQTETLKANTNTIQAIHFSDRLVLRVLTGPEAGKAYAIVNSLCIGRSTLSELQVDDFTMAERQILIQRQGNEILVKNLSPVLEMRVNGWVCNDSVLTVGSQLSIDQHRFMLQSSCPDFTQVIDTVVAEVALEEAVPTLNYEREQSKPKIFSRAQWILLASAILISGLLILLLTITP